MDELLPARSQLAGPAPQPRPAPRPGHPPRTRLPPAPLPAQDPALAQDPAPTWPRCPPGTPHSPGTPHPPGSAPAWPRSHLAPLGAVSARTSGDTELPAQPSPGRGRARCACVAVRARAVAGSQCWARGRPRWSPRVGCERVAPQTRGPAPSQICYLSRRGVGDRTSPRCHRDRGGGGAEQRTPRAP